LTCRFLSSSRSVSIDAELVSFRLSQFVRNHLIWETGHDVDPDLVEEEVRAKLIVWEEKKNAEEMKAGEEEGLASHK